MKSSGVSNILKFEYRINHNADLSSWVIIKRW